MTKARIHLQIDEKQKVAVVEKSKALGKGQSEWISEAIDEKLGHHSTDQENARLKEQLDCERQMLEIERARCRKWKSDYLESQESVKTITVNHKASTDAMIENLNRKLYRAKKALNQVASHLGVSGTSEHYEQVADHCKHRIDELEQKLLDANTQASDQSGKVLMLLGRNWFQRLFNLIPWTEEESESDQTAEA